MRILRLLGCVMAQDVAEAGPEPACTLRALVTQPVTRAHAHDIGVMNSQCTAQGCCYIKQGHR